MNRLALGGTAITGGLAGAVVPIAALLTLEPADYGVFSVVYLLFAFGLSLQLSLVSEAWMRGSREERTTDGWGDYWSAASVLAITVGILVTAVGWLLAGLGTTAIVAAGAASVAMLRAAARYYDLTKRPLSRVIAGDIGLSIAFVGAMLVLQGIMPAVQAAFTAWLISGAVGLTAQLVPAFTFGRSPADWLHRHREQIRPLLLDSLLLDAGSIGTPFVLAPMLGAGGFGVYRGISNIALPVRLLVDPLRPAIGRVAPRNLFAARSVASATAVAAVLAAAAFAVLAYLIPMVTIRLGTLASLTGYALPCAIFVAASFLSHVAYIASRNHADARGLLSGRLVQTLGAIGAPVLGFLLGGLDGAVTGFVVATCVSTVGWIVVLRRSAQQPISGPARP